MEWEVLVRYGMYSKTQCVLSEMWITSEVFKEGEICFP